MTAKTQAIGHGNIHRCLDANVGNIVQIAFWIRVIQVDGGRVKLFLQGFGTDNGFHGANCANAMPGHAFGT